MWFFCVVLFLQISNKAHLEAVNVLDVSKDDLQLVIIEHVHTLPTLAQVTLERKGVTTTVRFSEMIQFTDTWLQGYDTEMLLECTILACLIS